MKPIAIIPARGGSKRLPRKNVLPVCGRPMLAWPIAAALESGLFGEVIVSTEDEEIAAAARAAGARAVPRPPELATDAASEIMVYRHVLESLGAAAPPGFCALYATALLVTPADLREAAEKLEAGADVVMSVCEFPLHPFKALERGEDGFYKMIHPAECLMRSQTYPRYVASNGTFYWFRTEAFLRGPTYYPEKLAVHVLPYARAVDIDTAEEFEIAELFKRHQLSGAPAL